MKWKTNTRGEQVACVSRESDTWGVCSLAYNPTPTARDSEEERGSSAGIEVLLSSPLLPRGNPNSDGSWALSDWSNRLSMQ